MDYELFSKTLFNFNQIQNIKPIYKIFDYLSPYDVCYLKEIATSYTIKEVKQKYQLIENLMNVRGFKKLGCGTNRMTFKCESNPDIVMKIAVDRTGMNDSPAELRNKQILGTYATDIYDVSECGTVGLFERVEPITNVNDFLSNVDIIFNILFTLSRSGYIFKDVGNNSFMNYGIRKGAGPVILDYPYFYKKDPKKETCRNIFNGAICLGKVAFDKGFNTLRCTKCGKEYLLHELKDPNANLGIKIKGSNKGEIDMKITIKLKNGKTYVKNTGKETENIINDTGYDKYNIPSDEDLELEYKPPKNDSLVVNMKDILGYKEEEDNKQRTKSKKNKIKSKFIPENKKETSKSFNKKVEKIVEEHKETIDEDSTKAIITEDIINQLKDSMVSDEEVQQDYSKYEDEDIEEYREEDIIAEDETENQETFEKIKKQDKSNVYDEY